MKKNKMFIILGLLCLMSAGITYYIRDKEIKKVDKERVSISKLVERNDNNIDKLSFVNIYVTPYMIADYKNDVNAFYIVYDNNYYSILYMNKKEASKITKEMVDNGYRIEGVTKAKPNGIEEYGIEFLKKIFESHEENDGHNHDVNEEDYEDYFGNIYLDATISKYANYTIYNIIIWLFGIAGTVFLLTPIYGKIENDNYK